MQPEVEIWMLRYICAGAIRTDIDVYDHDRPGLTIIFAVDLGKVAHGYPGLRLANRTLRYCRQLDSTRCFTECANGGQRVA